MCVCFLCVFFPFILDIKFDGRTSRGHAGGRSHRISHPPSFCGACPIIFLARRIQPFLSLVDREETSPGEERSNETGNLIIADGSVEFCEATPIGLVDEPKVSLYGRETDHLRSACRCVA